MDITTRIVRGCKIMDLSGKIVLGPDTMAVRNAVREAAADKPKKIILNLGGVSYIDSAGIGELVSSYTHVGSQGGKLVLLSLTKKINELLVITKLITVFETFEDEQSAIADCI